MPPKQLFYASLEAHNKAYLDQVKLNQVNIEYQAMENKIVQEGNRMQLSQAEIQNKLDQMKKELIQATIQKIVPFNKTDISNSKQIAKQNVTSILNDVINKLPVNPTSFASELEQKVKNPGLKVTIPKKKEEKKESPLQIELKAKIAKRSSPSTISSSQAETSSTSASMASSAYAQLDFEKTVTQLRKEIRDKLELNNIPESEWPPELRGKIKSGTNRVKLNEIYSELMSNNIIQGSGLLRRKNASKKNKKN